MSRRKPLSRVECVDWIMWEGSTEQLTAAGVVSAEQLGAAAALKTPGRKHPDVTLPCGRTGSIRRSHGRRDAWLVYEHFTPDEAAPRAARREREKLRERFASVAKVRAAVARGLESGAVEVMRAFNVLDQPQLPYRFDAETKLRVLAAVCALKEALAQGRITLAALPGGPDPDFEAFMRTALPPASARAS